jgi:AcrR family transcriptional regulator
VPEVGTRRLRAVAPPRRNAPELHTSPESPLAPRKTPRQRRARTTVECILQATEELVQQHGFAAVGTRLIAERAGVSIGSLYQYFPTYESILLSWYEGIAAAAARRMKMATVDVLDQELESSIRTTLRALLSIYEDHALVLIRMPGEVPEIARATSSTSFEYLNRGVMRLYFNQHHEFDPRDTESHIFFLESLIMSILRRYVIERPRHLKRAAVLDEVAGLVAAYLRRHLAPPGKARSRQRVR